MGHGSKKHPETGDPHVVMSYVVLRDPELLSMPKWPAINCPV